MKYKNDLYDINKNKLKHQYIINSESTSPVKFDLTKMYTHTHTCIYMYIYIYTYTYKKRKKSRVKTLEGMQSSLALFWKGNPFYCYDNDLNELCEAVSALAC